MRRKQRTRPARPDRALDAEQRLARHRWVQSLAFPCMVFSGLQITAKLLPYSHSLAMAWLIVATVTAGMMLQGAVRGWVIWWRRRSK